MRTHQLAWLAVALLGVFGLTVAAQQGVAPRPAPAPSVRPATPTAPAPAGAHPPAVLAPTPPPLPTTVAATVNGQPIMEVAVLRSLKRWPAESHAQVRPEIINYLIDKILVDQHLAQLRIAIDNNEIEAKLKLIREESQKQGMGFDKLLREMFLTEAELRGEITGQLRWDKFVQEQATEKALRELFAGNRDIFDGTMVRARHVLLTPSDPQSAAQTRTKLLALKQHIEGEVAQGMAKLPAATDNLAREKERVKLLENSFAAVAGKESMCPTRNQGGDLGFFPRAGSMVEPFAAVAYSLKPHQLSDVVATQYGQHLILVTERRPGKEIKFEDVKDEVKEVYGDRVRENLLAKLRASAKISINPPPH